MRHKFALMVSFAVLFASVLTTSKPVYAMSAGCAQINADGYSQANLSIGGNYVLEAGEVITLTQTSDPSSRNADYYIWQINGSIMRAGPAHGNGSISWVVLANGTYNLAIGYDLNGPGIIANATCAVGSGGSGGAAGSVSGVATDGILRTITAWGAGGARAIVWQWQDSSDRWWWLTVPNTDKKLETSIEYRDRVGSNGEAVPNYPLSRITGGRYALPDDPAKFRVFNADTLEELHGVWIEIGEEGSLDRLSVFIP